MTKRKKFQERVRARMNETGENYTDAMVSLNGELKDAFAGLGLTKSKAVEGLDDTVRKLLGCTEDYQVRSGVEAFHVKVFGKTPGADRLTAHVLDILLPKRASWANGEERADIELRQPEAEDTLRELLTLYAAEGLVSGMGKKIPKAFKVASGWLGAFPREEAPQGPSSDDFEFDPEGSPPRHCVLSQEEERDLGRLWKRAPNVGYRFEMGHEPPKMPVTQINVNGGADSREIIKVLNEALRDPAPSVGVLKALEKENAALRRKLRDAGIDPDA